MNSREPDPFWQDIRIVFGRLLVVAIALGSGALLVLSIRENDAQLLVVSLVIFFPSVVAVVQVIKELVKGGANSE